MRSMLRKLLLSFCFLCLAKGTVIFVGPESTAGIGGAIQRAVSGDTLVLAPGRYTGLQNCNLTVSLPLTIQSTSGQSANSTFLDCAHALTCIVVTPSGSGTVLRGFGIRNCGQIASTRFYTPTQARGMPEFRHTTTDFNNRANHSRLNPGLDFRDVANALAKMNLTEARQTLLLWAKLSSAMNIIHALPNSVVSHSALRARANQEPSPLREPAEGGGHDRAAALLREDCAAPPDETATGCQGAMVFSAWCGSFTDGTVGDKYASSRACTWLIDPPGASSVFVSFSILSIEYAVDCEFDFLRFFTGNRELFKLCGAVDGGPRSILLCAFPRECNLTASDLISGIQLPTPLTVYFESDSSDEELGFHLSWVASPDCHPDYCARADSDAAGGCLRVEGATATVDGMNFQGCVAVRGGAIAAISASVIISKSLIADNVARSGAGVYADRSAIQLRDVQLVNNLANWNASIDCSIREFSDLGSAFGAGGGGAFLLASSAQFTGVDFVSNVALFQCRAFSSGVGGGAILSLNSSITLSSCSVHRNSAACNNDDDSCWSRGGGLSVLRGGVVLTSVAITNNSVSAHLGHGGGMHVRNAFATITASRFQWNQLFVGTRPRASAFGGALNVEDISGVLLIHSSAFQQNAVSGTQAMGGALAAARSNLSIVACNLSHNVMKATAVQGGGLWLQECSLLTVASKFDYNLVIRVSITCVETDCVSGGGGIFAVSARLVCTASQFSHNAVLVGAAARLETFRGGGLCTLGDSRVSLVQVSVVNNKLACEGVGVQTVTCGGGGLALEKHPSHAKAGSATLSLCHVAGNVLQGYSYGLSGGGILFSGVRNSSLTILGSNVTGNLINARPTPGRASGDTHFMNGCGICAMWKIALHAWNSNLGSNQCVASEPQAPLGRGGALFLSDSAVLIESCRLGNNSLSTTFNEVWGGALYLQRTPAVVIRSMLGGQILLGTPASGGAVSLTAARATFWLSSLGENHVSGYPTFTDSAHWTRRGGAIYCSASDLEIKSSEIGRNSLKGDRIEGGAVWAKGCRVILNSTRLGQNILTAKFFAAGGSLLSDRSEVDLRLASLDNNSLSALHVSGGGVSSVQSKLWVTLSGIDSNLLSGVNTAQGGAMRSVDTLTRMSGVSCSRNLLEAPGNVFGGGCDVEGGRFVGQNLSISHNALLGSSSRLGGGVRGHSANVSLDECWIAWNRAGSGGGLSLSGVAVVDVLRSHFLHNDAGGFGGAILVEDNAHTLIFSSVLFLNSALLADNLASFGDSVQVDLVNTSSVSSGTFTSIVRGSHIRLFDGSQHASSNKGWELQQEFRPGFVIVRFIKCPQGFYLLRNSTTMHPIKCNECTTSNFCAGGDRVASRGGFWTWLSSTGVLQPVRCPDGYCCSRATCFPYNYCEANRFGLLCGQCRPGFSENLVGIGCVPNEECKYFPWVLLGIAVGTFVLVNVLVFVRLRKSQALVTPVTADGGGVKILLYFIQVLPLCTTSEIRADLGISMQVLSAILNLDPAVSGGGPSFCPFAGFSTIQKIASRFVIPMFCLVWLGLRKVVVSVTQGNSDTSSGGHAAAFFVVLGFSYSALAKSTFQFLACVPLQGRQVLFLEGNLDCYQPWQVVVFLTAVPMLVCYPLFICGVHHVGRSRLPPVVYHNILKVIAAPFRQEWFYTGQWEAVLMLQRLVLTIVSVFVGQQLWRIWAIAVLMVTMLVLQMLVRPFIRRACNLLMALSQTMLVCLSCWSIHAVALEEQAATVSSTKAQKFAAIASILVSTPLLLCVVLTLSPLLERITPAWWNRLLQQQERPWNTAMVFDLEVDQHKLTHGNGCACADAPQPEEGTEHELAIWAHGSDEAVLC